MEPIFLKKESWDSCGEKGNPCALFELEYFCLTTGNKLVYQNQFIFDANFTKDL